MPMLSGILFSIFEKFTKKIRNVGSAKKFELQCKPNFSTVLPTLLEMPTINMSQSFIQDFISRRQDVVCIDLLRQKSPFMMLRVPPCCVHPIRTSRAFVF